MRVMRIFESLKVKPKIGVMAVGLAAYWPQFPGMRDKLLNHHTQLLEKFPNSCEVISAGMVDSVEGGARAGDLFHEHDVDVVFCQLTTYSSSETLLPAVRRLNAPVILLNVQSVVALDMENVKSIQDWLGTGCTCAGLPEMTSALKRLHKRFDVITGYLNGDIIADRQIATWSKVASVSRRMKTQNLALLGRPYPGMMDLYVDETSIFEKFGTYVHHLQWQDVIDEMTCATTEEQSALNVLMKTFTIPQGVNSDDLRNAAMVLVAFCRIAEKYQLCGIPNHFEGHITSEAEADLLSGLNPALSILNTHGVPCPVEGDIKTALAMIIMKHISGSATLAELYSMDLQNDVCIIGHSGAGDASISDLTPVLRMSDVFHGKSGGAFVTQFFPRIGPVTLVSLTQDEHGQYTLIAAEGQCVEGPTLNLGDTNARIRFSCGLREFVNSWSGYGPTHHGVMSSGHWVETMRAEAILLDMPLCVITGDN